MITTTTKLKRGTDREFNGQTVYIYRQIDERSACICDNKLMRYDDTYTVVLISELKEVFKGRNRIATKPPTAESKAIKSDMTTFYRSFGCVQPFHCQNCFKPLYACNDFFQRSICAHILPKAEFESVKMHPDNIMFLGVDLIGLCNCHDQWDRQGREHRSKMKCYDQAIRNSNYSNMS